MLFRNLPADLHVGGFVDLSPCNRINSPSLPECQTCKWVDMDYFQCDKQHVTCSNCAFQYKCAGCPKHTVIIWCCECEGRVTAVEKRIPEDELRKKEFRCNCGFVGTLKIIKKHLSSPQEGAMCNATKLLEAESDIGRAAVELAEKLKRLELDTMNAARKLPIRTEQLTELIESNEGLMAQLRISLFQFNSDQLWHDRKVICHPIDRDLDKFADYRVKLHIVEKSNIHFVTLTITAPNEKKKISAPRNLVFRIHAYDGGVVAEKCLVFGEDGEFHYQSSPVRDLDLISFKYLIENTRTEAEDSSEVFVSIGAGVST